MAAASARGRPPVLVDCLGTWLTALVDDADAWEQDIDAVHQMVVARTDEVVEALRACDHDVVVVTNEVGLGDRPRAPLRPALPRPARHVNQRVAAACDEVHLVVAGRVLRL